MEIKVVGYAIVKNSPEGPSIQLVHTDKSLVEESIDDLCHAYGLDKDDDNDRDMFEVEIIDIYIANEEDL